MTDQEIVNGILCRDVELTKQYLYIDYYPMFKSVWNKYYTDCESCLEFINTIYVYIMTPGRQSKECPLESFGFRCSLGMWLKIISENYCKSLYKKRIQAIDKSEDVSDRKIDASTSLDVSRLNKSDIMVVLKQIKNSRYRELIRLRYLEDKDNGETAILLGMSMDNYYNKHKRAKEQLIEVLKKEGLV